MVALDGKTLPSLVVAIAPILGTIMYEARSHYHQVLEDIVTYQEFDSLCVCVLTVSSGLKRLPNNRIPIPGRGVAHLDLIIITCYLNL